MEKEAQSSPVYYMWVNATCHNYLLEKFSVEPMHIPTVVYYSPEKLLYGNLVGNFAKDTIKQHQDRFVSGRLPTLELESLDEIQFQNIDCTNQQLDYGENSDSDLDDEILREILA